MQIKDLIPWGRETRETSPSGGDGNPVSVLRHDMNRVFDDFWGRLDRSFGDPMEWPAGTDLAWPPYWPSV